MQNSLNLNKILIFLCLKINKYFIRLKLKNKIFLVFYDWLILIKMQNIEIY